MTDLRSDIICEKARSPFEIRWQLAQNIKYLRKLGKQDSVANHVTTGYIRALQWVLKNDVSPQAYYKEQYKRDYPNA